MGLDLLPDNLDLSRSSRNTVRGLRVSENGSWTRSLPESPRVSSVWKSDSDVCRLSLQLNRENNHEVFGRWRTKYEESPSSGHNERVITRRLGMYITNLLEKRRAEAPENKTEHKKVRSKFSQREKTHLCSNKMCSRRYSKSGNEQPLRPINVSKFSFYSTPYKRIKQKRAFISTSTNSKPDQCDPSDKKKCKKIQDSSCVFNISLALSADSATERPRKQMERADEPEWNADATISSGQMYKHEENTFNSCGPSG